MIPRQLILKNFLSYRDAQLDFSGLHVACVSGANGAGKSSLLEAIAWAIWGQSRVASDDDVIRQGAMEAQVDLIFEHNHQTYRVLRCRRRQQGGTLEFQIHTKQGFRTLTQRGMRSTQDLICRHLKVDYETFVNSAYLRQGRADDFMLKRPGERKQILADLLKLDRYDRLAQTAKEKLRDGKAQIAVLQQQVKHLETRLQERCSLLQTYQELEARLEHLNQDYQQGQTVLGTLQQQVLSQQAQQQQLVLQEQQATHLQQSVDRLRTEKKQLEAERQTLQQKLDQEADILQGYAEWQRLQAEDQQLTATFQRYQAIQMEREPLVQDLTTQQHLLTDRQRQIQTRLDATEQELQEINPCLQKADKVQAVLQKLHQARSRLKQLDDLQLQVAPLLRRRQTLEASLDRAKTRLTARLEELVLSEQQLQTQQAQQPQILQAAMEVTQSVSYLEKRRAYQDQVREKGLERRSFMEQLQANQRTYEAQLSEINQKLRLLADPDAVCPLCDRPLDQHHWQVVQQKHQLQQKDLQDQLWVIREQLTTSEREIQVLRQEYREVEAELERYSALLQRQGRLQAHLSSSADMQSRLQQLEGERQQLEACLQQHSYATDLHQELQQIDRTLAELAYDDRDHALVRGQVERWRWAEIKQAEIDQARRRWQHLNAEKPKLAAQLKEMQTAQQDLAQSPLAQQIEQLDQQLASLNYSFDQHQALRHRLQRAQSWQLAHQGWEQARQQRPQIDQKLLDLQTILQTRCEELHQVQAQIGSLKQQLQAGADPSAQMQVLDDRLRQIGQQRDQLLARRGALQQQLQHLEDVQVQLVAHQQSLQTGQTQVRVYRELAEAFGRNGIQSLMIENLLPQLETETNHLLSRLSGSQLHVQFVTQRVSRRRQSKLIDTLDILIADPQGTRAYETYSGGEAFRINFAIRLALARLLAQRSGMALQLLIIDEGFGTQDREGCERLISAINAIAADFACILTVTHIPHFREAFQTRIDVVKTERGSQLTLSM